MTAYVVLMLGKLDKVETKLFVSMAGIFSIILGVSSALGITFFAGFPYNLLHGVAVFISLGNYSNKLYCSAMR